MALNILKPGLLTTIQDLGRYRYQDLGVNVGGAMDTFALRLANLLIGNKETEAGLEMTMAGGSFSFDQDCLIAICGGDFRPTIDGGRVSMWRPIYIKKGTVLNFSYAKKGIRAYMAVSGGFNVSEIMGSKSTHIKAQFGGFEGRPLQKGDCVPLGPFSKTQVSLMAFLEHRLKSPFFSEANWSIRPSVLPTQTSESELRVMIHSDAHLFKQQSLNAFFHDSFTITSQSDRMGYRLKGNPLDYKTEQSILSEPIQMGAIQVPPDGQPIILMADRQTTGGYPIIGHVIQADLPLLAQSKPGDTLCFKTTTIEAAQEALIEREQSFRLIERESALKMKQAASFIESRGSL